MTTKTKTKKATKPKADQAKINRERQRSFRLRHDKPMSLNPKMAADRVAIVLGTWTPAHVKSVMAMLSKAAAK